ncbi:MAG: thioredoxin domain-containing protein [Candidatus Sifarchaeia archaeon]
MILLFTSDHCAWCDVVKGMIENEIEGFEDDQPMHEINVDKHSRIAEAYGILVVPTLVSRGYMLSGVPCQEDLQLFLLRSIAARTIEREEARAQTLLRSARQRRTLRPTGKIPRYVLKQIELTEASKSR